MLSHVIPPPRGYTKAPNCLVRHPRLGSDAKVLVLYVQGLPEEDRDKALGEHARALRMTGRAYQKAKADLVTHGYVHEKRESLDGGRWRTVQVFSNEPLTADQAARLRSRRSRRRVRKRGRFRRPGRVARSECALSDGR